MEFRLSITMDNAAFEDAPGYELCRLLRQVETRILSDGARSITGDGISLRDSNGNRVGVARISRDQDQD